MTAKDEGQFLMYVVLLGVHVYVFVHLHSLILSRFLSLPYLILSPFFLSHFFLSFSLSHLSSLSETATESACVSGPQRRPVLLQRDGVGLAQRLHLLRPFSPHADHPAEAAHHCARGQQYVQRLGHCPRLLPTACQWLEWLSRGQAAFLFM